LWDFTHTENASDGSLNSNANVLLLLLLLLVVVVVVMVVVVVVGEVVVVVTRRQDYDLDKLREPNNS